MLRRGRTFERVLLASLKRTKAQTGQLHLFRSDAAPEPPLRSFGPAPYYFDITWTFYILIYLRVLSDPARSEKLLQAQ
jgi:hypothetical protein